MGFWTLTQKWALAGSGQAKLVPQEFYAVRAPGTVKRTFPLVMKRGSADVVARLREGSKVEVLLWSGSLPTVEEAESNVKKDEWYLIQSEGGLIGWVPGHLLQDHLELPWAG